MRLPDTFMNTVRSVHGEKGEAWLQAFPDLIRRCEARWSFRVGEPYSLSFNFAAPVRFADGSEAVLKLGVPNKELTSEAGALRHFGGIGAIRAIEALPEEGILLLEKADPGHSLHSVPEEEAVRIAAAVMAKLHRPAPADRAPFPTVEIWFRGLERLRSRFGGGTGPIPEELVAKAEERLAELRRTPRPHVLLHGDLHHGNILSARREPWLAIDPKGIVGEAEYEPCSYFMNEIDSKDPQGQARRRALTFADAMGRDPDRILRWAYCHAMLSAWWCIEDGVGQADRQVGLALHLDAIIQT
ncbi:aminoglycoside phosphotransferase family protein [Cohnella caldifontis]|uniref:aminoglycoside phosphotransferase family protein n=1 Tax=Cohnella caldifontis TaxID=3027471 RepID=UPI0023ECC9F1|nr:aminoglycoside phosphotransferase family protein [Cohnella sp. YIM B05605]